MSRFLRLWRMTPRAGRGNPGDSQSAAYPREAPCRKFGWRIRRSSLVPSDKETTVYHQNLSSDVACRM